MIASFGLFVNPLITCMITPIYLWLFGSNKSRQSKVLGQALKPPQKNWLDFFVDFIAAHKKKVLIGFLWLTLVIGLFGFRVKLENDYVAIF